MRHAPEIIEVDDARLEDVLRRVEQALDEQDSQLVRAVFAAYAYVVDLVEDKNTTIRRLRQVVFGARTEKTADVVGRSPETSDPAPPSGTAVDASIAPAEACGDGPDPAEPSRTRKPATARGHGRNGADAYEAAVRIEVPHASLQAGDACPECDEGTVYEKPPGVIVRITGQPPLTAKVYELQKLRCNLCGQVFTALPPADAGDRKYDATAGSMIGLLKYGTGLPFHRLDGLQGQLGVPLPASTQWDIVQATAANLTPAFVELLHQAAQGEVVHNDDTTVKILELMGQHGRQDTPHDVEHDASGADERKGLYTSGVVALRGGCQVALFFSGRRHAGENLAEVLAHRLAELPPPIQMCDALSRNLPGELQTIVAHCLAHARRQFVDVYEQFPEPCGHLLESLAVVYHNDAMAREQQLSPEARLQFHQEASGPTMQDLHAWLNRQLDEKQVEPNSGLGHAIKYMLRHWDKLTLFLREPGAPLDNNVCERALKKAILHRKNALFYKTQNGARVGDLFLSLIYTCELNQANPFDYLTELQRHRDELAASPERWMPWNYREALG
jgi:transposase